LFVGRAHFMLGNDDQAVFFLRKSVSLHPRFQQSLLHLAAVLGTKGQVTEAREFLKRYLELRYVQSRTITQWRTELRTKNPKYVATFERLAEGLRKAGMPEN